jgi:TPR repeat protein
MRFGLVLAALSLLPLGGCGDVHFARGLPVVAKDPNGLLISGAGGLPDVERGNQARVAGRLDEAERDLLPLAQRGYADAQIYLAAVYGQREAVEAQDEAIKWYREVLPRRPDVAIPLARVLMRRGDHVSVVAAGELLTRATDGLDREAVRAARLDLYSLFPALDVRKEAPALASAAGQSEVMGVRAAAINWYRASLTGAGNARQLIELCRKNLDAVPACYVDLATYYRYTGNAQALADLVTKAMQGLRRPPANTNFDDFYYDPVALPPIASRLAVALIDQPVSEDLTELNEDLALTKQAESAAEAEAAEESLDDVPAPGAVPQYADASVVTERASSAASLPGASSPAASSPSASPAAPARGASSPAATSLATSSAPASSAPAAGAPAANAAYPELADKLLRWMLAESAAMSVEAAGVAVAFPYLLPDVNLEAVLKTGASAGIPRASLYLGQLYYFNQRVPREAALGEASLKRAIQFRETAAPGHYRLGRLYQQGYLGRPDPQQALDNFLYAARRRVTAADTHLARLFYDSPGARIDRVSSYVFARLSEDGGVPVVIHSLRSGSLSGFRLLDRLRNEMTPDQLQRAESLYQQEREVHLVTQPIVSPLVWVKDAG